MLANPWVRVFACACVASVLIALGIVGASAQEHRHGHPPQDAGIHDRFYSTWMRPDKPESSCCNNLDCYPAEAKMIAGRWWAKRREDGKWLLVPDAKVEQRRDSPDGRNHLCAPKPQYEAVYEGGVICFLAGAGI